MTSLAAPAVAQEPTTEVPDLPLQFGPLLLAPQVQFAAVHDTNIYNENVNPKEDIVTSTAPQTRVFTKLGRVMIDGRGEGSAEYYRTYSEQNSINMVGSATLAIPFNRVTPHVTYTALSSRERFGFEIDARLRRHEQTIAGGVDIRVASTTVLAVRAQREREQFDEDTAFRGENIAQALSREMRLTRISLRHPLSALTTLTISADRSEDRFEFRPDRDAQGTSLSGGLTFKPTALIAGGFTVGYLRFKPVARTTPDFKGIISSADLSYVLGGVTRFGVQAQRNVTYSYDPTTPYYVLSGVDASVTHRAGERWGISGRIGRYLLNYVSVGAVTPSPGVQPDASTDTSELVGVGLSYQITSDTQIGVDVDRQRRLSDQPLRQFEGTRIRSTLGLRF